MFSDLIGPGAGAPPAGDSSVPHILRACVADLEPRREEIVVVLRQRMVELMSAQVAALPGGALPMCRRLTDALMVAAAMEPGAAHSTVVVQGVGAANEAEGFPSDQYGTVTHAVLYALRATYGGEWSSALSSGWVEFLMWFRTLLLSGAEARREADQEEARSRAALEAARSGPPPVASGVPPRPDELLRVGRTQPVPTFPVAERVAARRDDLDDDLDGEDEPAYGQPMVSMTGNARRDRRRR